MSILPVIAEASFKPRLYELDAGGLEEWCVAHGFPAYRSGQIRRWIFGRRVDEIAEMHDVPATLRTALANEFSLFPAREVQHQVSQDGTEKLLLELHDGQFIECVLMRETDRRTICISTQVGCAMGCVFCASGLLGLNSGTGFEA